MLCIKRLVNNEISKGNYRIAGIIAEMSNKWHKCWEFCTT